MERIVASITLYRFAGVLVAYGDEAQALAGELRPLGVRLLWHRATRRSRAGFPDAEPFRSLALRRLAELGVPVEIVDGEGVVDSGPPA